MFGNENHLSHLRGHTPFRDSKLPIPHMAMQDQKEVIVSAIYSLAFKFFPINKKTLKIKQYLKSNDRQRIRYPADSRARHVMTLFSNLTIKPFIHIWTNLENFGRWASTYKQATAHNHLLFIKLLPKFGAIFYRMLKCTATKSEQSKNDPVCWLLNHIFINMYALWTTACIVCN